MLQSRVADLEANPTVSAAEVQELRQRVRELGADASIGSVLGTQAEMQKQMSEVLGKGSRLRGRGSERVRGGCTTTD